jgi:hypothetical protein
VSTVPSRIGTSTSRSMMIGSLLIAGPTVSGNQRLDCLGARTSLSLLPPYRKYLRKMTLPAGDGAVNKGQQRNYIDRFYGHPDTQIGFPV